METPQNLPLDSSHRVSTSGDIEVGTYLEIAREKAGQQSVTSGKAVSGA